MKLVGMFISLSEADQEVSSRREAFMQGLGQASVGIALRCGEGGSSDYNKIAAELIGLNPDAIFTSCWPTMMVLSNLTDTIPIVYAGLFDWNQRGGDYFYKDNVTGFVAHDFDVCTGWLPLLRQIAPNMTQVAVISEMATPCGAGQFQIVQEAAPKGFVSPINVVVKAPASDLKAAIDAFAKRTPGGGLILTPGALTATLRQTVIDAATNGGLPAIYPNRLYAIHGGLMSYGADLLGLYRGAGTYVSQILGGAQPSTLGPTINHSFEVAINLRAAAGLKIKVPGPLLDRASLVVQ